MELQKGQKCKLADLTRKRTAANLRDGVPAGERGGRDLLRRGRSGEVVRRPLFYFLQPDQFAGGRRLHAPVRGVRGVLGGPEPPSGLPAEAGGDGGGGERHHAGAGPGTPDAGRRVGPGGLCLHRCGVSAGEGPDSLRGVPQGGIWRFSVVDSGFNGGLSALLAHFGGEEVKPDPADPGHLLRRSRR